MRSGRYCLAVAAALIVVTHTSAALASGWTMPVEGATATLGFGVAYAGGTHRGVDLAAAAGAEVVSPAEGTVTFAGRVPADGGGTCGAVTVELADGHRVSLMPLEGLCIAAGDSVAAGSALGSLAGSGDDSSGAAHLHVGLRSGELYLDPAPFLPCGGGAATDLAPEASPAVVPDPPAITGVDTAPAVTAGATASAAAASPAGAVVSAAASHIEPAEVVQPATAADAPVAAPASEPVADRGARQADVSEPNTAPHTVRKGAHVPATFARPVVSGILALGMLATGIAIVRVRRAVPVRVR